MFNRKSYHSISSTSNRHHRYMVFGQGRLFYFGQMLAVSRQKMNRMPQFLRTHWVTYLYHIRNAFHCCCAWGLVMSNWQISDVICMPGLSCSSAGHVSNAFLHLRSSMWSCRSFYGNLSRYVWLDSPCSSRVVFRLASVTQRTA